MGASHSVEESPPDLEEPELEEEVVSNYEEEYEEKENELDTLFLYWWF
jgi:hypothetical protein